MNNIYHCKSYVFILFFFTLLVSGSSWGSGKDSRSEKFLTHAQLMEVVRGKSDEQIARALVGRKVSLKLTSTAPDALMVTRRDGVYFLCAIRAKGFIDGLVNARIIEVEATHEGDLSIVLDRCGR